MRAVAASVQANVLPGQSIRGSGVDFSGRHWLRASLSPEALRFIAETFLSVQSLHTPLISYVAHFSTGSSNRVPNVSTPGNAGSLPAIGIVDTGVPINHAVLSPFRRGTYASPLNAGGTGDHASFVSSRAILGDQTPESAASGTSAGLRFFDINVGLAPNQIDEKEVLPALEAVTRTTPDLRVFNLSFDCGPLDLYPTVERQERLILARDLDNFIFQYDVLVVVSAGNSQPGILPSPEYPHHYLDPNWQLGAFARSFNSLTCGSYVSQLSVSGLVRQVGWPSPFCRVGPGLGNSPKPDFSASGGNVTPNYAFGPGLGVWGLANNGTWDERIGTSYSAPLLARECAFAFRSLEGVCDPGSHPYASTVKAFLALTASGPVSDPASVDLVQRTLGHGTANSHRLSSPIGETAVLLWQGVLDDRNDILRVQIPIPRDWLAEASLPSIRLVVAADVPVNSAVEHVWASRKIVFHLRHSPDSRALTPKRNRHSSDIYPLIAREYQLSKTEIDTLDNDIWILEISYAEEADYLPLMTFPSQQRVAFAAELFDAGTSQSSPQPHLQAMSFTRTMTRLSVPPASAKVPVVLRYQS